MDAGSLCNAIMAWWETWLIKQFTDCLAIGCPLELEPRLTYLFPAPQIVNLVASALARSFGSGVLELLTKPLLTPGPNIASKLGGILC
jgi:hypothetical protein